MTKRLRRPFPARRGAIAAAAAAALLLASAPAGAQQRPATAPSPATPAAGREAPPMRVHGRVIETRDQLYKGERAISGFDVADAGHRPALAALGARTAPEPVDRDELRAKRLALYGGALETKAAGSPPAPPSASERPVSEAAPPARDRLPWILGTGGTLLALVGILLALRRQRARVAAS